MENLKVLEKNFGRPNLLLWRGSDPSEVKIAFIIAQKEIM